MDELFGDVSGVELEIGRVIEIDNRLRLEHDGKAEDDEKLLLLTLT